MAVARQGAADPGEEGRLMGRSEEIQFTVLACNRRGNWETKGHTSEMHAAITAAKQMVADGKVHGVKVSQTFFDEAHGRQVSSTVFEQGDPPKGPSLTLWIGIAVLAGAASFAATYFLTH
jgi:allantoicase